MPSLVDGQKEKRYPSWKAHLRVNLSYSIIGIMICVCAAAVAGVYVLRGSLYTRIGEDAAIVASIVNAVQVKRIT